MPFTKALKDSEFDMTYEEAREIFYKFNNDGTTHINITDFLIGIRVSCEKIYLNFYLTDILNYILAIHV